MDQTAHDRLLIIDFGSQVTQLIARRLRELNVYCEIHPYQNVTDAFLAEFSPRAVIFSGGPASVIDDGSPRPPESVFSLGVPILGICYGQQVMMQCLGGKVERGHGTAEFGRAFVTPSDKRIPLLDGRPETVAALAKDGMERLKRARAARAQVARAAAPAMLLGWKAEGILKRAASQPERVAAGALAGSEFSDNVGLMLRAFSGRW